MSWCKTVHEYKMKILNAKIHCWKDLLTDTSKDVIFECSGCNY